MSTQKNGFEALTTTESEKEVYILSMYDENGDPLFDEEELDAEMQQYVFEFEEAWQRARPVKVYDLLGRPSYFPAAELDDQQLRIELHRIQQLLRDNAIHLDAPGKSSRQIYEHITEALFEEEVDDLKLDGLSRHFYF